MSTRNAEATPFKLEAHALIDALPEDATWKDLAAEVQFQIELEEAVCAAEKSFTNAASGAAPANETRSTSPSR